MAFSGVRISWLSVARNRSFARLAASASRLRGLFVGQQRLAVALDLFRIAANGVGERLVHRLVEPRHVIEVAQVWGRFALAPQSEHACAKRPVFGDHRPQLETRHHPAHFRGRTMPALSHHRRRSGGCALGFLGLLRRRSGQTACPPPSRAGCLRLRRAAPPDRPSALRAKCRAQTTPTPREWVPHSPG